MRFYYFVFLAILLLSFKQENSDELLWQSKKKLTWENFKALPDTGSSPAAITACKIRMDYFSKKDTLYVNVRAVLEQSRSWIRPKSKKNVLLAHEQIHFDIAELFARKLRQSYLQLKTKKTMAAEQLKSLDQQNDIALNQYQDLYDSETNHCRNAKKQMEWEKKIAKALKESDAFSQTTVKVLLVKE
jgi:hypothetical protein